jgi:hypothetical protein
MGVIFGSRATAESPSKGIRITANRGCGKRPAPWLTDADGVG